MAFAASSRFKSTRGAPGVVVAHGELLVRWLVAKMHCVALFGRQKVTTRGDPQFSRLKLHVRCLRWTLKPGIYNILRVFGFVMMQNKLLISTHNI